MSGVVLENVDSSVFVLKISWNDCAGGRLNEGRNRI